MNFVHVLFVILVAIKVYADDNPFLEALAAWKTSYGYVQVRPGAFLFYWLYYADGEIVGATKKPLIIWIQGGPGLAASGIANFAEIGPLDVHLEPRNHTWVNGRNLLLIDHPVGTGFSYATDPSLYVTTDRDMALDLSKVIKAFFRRNKEFRKTPTYLFSQSYGGKICPRLAYYLHTAIEKKRLKINFKGIGIGSAWVDPKESTMVQPQFLYNMGLIDQSTYLKTMSLAKEMGRYIDKKQYIMAGKLDTLIFKIINDEAGMYLNFNNIYQDNPYPALDVLARKVNKFVKPTLQPVVNSSLQWNYLSNDVFIKLFDSFVVPSTKFLEMLLNKTELKVAVYNGNLDIVTPIAGASNWVHKLKWHGAEEFKKTKRIAIENKNGFYKKHGRLSFWWVFGSGHWVPEDNPVVMEKILNHVISEYD